MKSSANNLFPGLQTKGADRNRNFMVLINEVEGRRRKSSRESPSEKTQSNGEEWFVDKSRNIGVSSGERDLKLQVKRKKSERRTLKAKNSDYKSLCKVSKQLLQCEDYRNSLNYLNQAAEVAGNNQEVFLLRAQCRLKLGLYEEAVRDANRLLTSDKSSIPALKVKAEALYQLGHLEHTLVQYEKIIYFSQDYELDKIIKKRNYCYDKIITFLEHYEFYPDIIHHIVNENATRKRENKLRNFGKLNEDVKFLSRLSEMESFTSNRIKFDKCQQIKNIVGDTLEQLKNNILV